MKTKFKNAWNTIIVFFLIGYLPLAALSYILYWIFGPASPEQTRGFDSIGELTFANLFVLAIICILVLWHEFKEKNDEK